MNNKESIKLNIAPRGVGKSHVRKLRKTSFIPCVVYGPKTKNDCFYIENRILLKYTGHQNDNTIFQLTSDDKKVTHALIKEITRHPVKNTLMHVDFYAPDMTETIRVNVELSFEGKAIGLQSGGVLNITKRNIEVECLPTNIPDALVIDITNLDVNQSLKVSDIPLPTDIKLMTPETESIATMAVVEEVAEAPQTVEGEAGAEDAAASSEGGDGKESGGDQDKDKEKKS